MAYTFYNVKQGALQVEIWKEAQRGLITIAPLLPNVQIPRGPIPEGTRLFDWQNKIVFSLEPAEALALLRHINEKRSDFLNLLHQPKNGKYTQLSVAFQNNKYLSIILKEVVGKAKRQHAIGLTNSSTIAQIDLFKRFLHAVGNLPFLV
ncbi:MAG: hypothetical protein DRG33_03885 [Deltaproteobacteria bacterium]|nr:MAG: hypothetical protein DRG33_03885 [Deltaproteobacteria bacterium]